ncbi:MAG: D-alanyl-D-alanine carboxypeptidase/D-alanyl-D-alanine-endopeptidase [Deltaproteobacteria bacterium]|nr:D-alanyl-D-alanine carboxypeptidase/D-alanyl-D-alanine-endopeptidase [Deltaproteobacteria bacterium]MBI4374114.1 D-alanyl-D-alanine carboxypeptidase/D-alanyl-D-alanine-endopeptidase [Deltaproteobacteria bacterium]
MMQQNKKNDKKGRVTLTKFVLFVVPFLLSGARLSAATLSENIDRILKHHRLTTANLSIKVVRLSDGAVLYEKEPDRSVNPASVVKLITAASALDILGPDYRFKTEFYTNRENGAGILGDLWIKGYGNPLFVTEELERLAQSIRAKGWKKVEGDLFVDDSFINHDPPTTYVSDDSERVYQVVTGPLSFNYNTVQVFVRPGRHQGDPGIVQLKPATRYFTVLNRTQTGGGREASISSRLEAGGRRLVIDGKLRLHSRELSFRQAVNDPALYTGTVIREALEAEGIQFAGTIRRGAVPGTARQVFGHSSPPLSELIRGMWKFSNNFLAEQLFLALGSHRYGPPGGLRKGRRVAGDYLASLGVSGDYYLENGSGLSKLSRLSADQIIAVLRSLYRKPWSGETISSLSVGGIDGTLKRRFKGMLKGKVFGKTGSLNHTAALAGYLMVRGEPVAFALLFDDFPASPRRVHKAEEQIIEAVYRDVH